MAGFDRHRPRLRALAYRMLGSVVDAEDAVQDTALRWHAANRDDVANPEAWLVRVCTRVCLDALRRRRREAYVGPWLPEPMADEPSTEGPAVLAESLRLAFLLLLERLTPHERAAFLLREVFDTPYSEVAEALGASEAACRQHVSRARRHLASGRARFRVAPRAEAELMARFAAAVQAGNLPALVALLAADAELVADSGGKAAAALNVVVGADRIARFFLGVAAKAPSHFTWTVATLNGTPAVVGTVGGAVVGAWSLASNGARITAVFAQRNPDKLARLQTT